MVVSVDYSTDDWWTGNRCSLPVGTFGRRQGRRRRLRGVRREGNGRQTGVESAELWRRVLPAVVVIWSRHATNSKQSAWSDTW